MQKEVIINIGVSGSGKSTWSSNFIANNSYWVRINRDDIRTNLVGNLDGYYQRKDLNKIEEAINSVEAMIFTLMAQRGYNIIIDNTNLKPSYIQRWVDFVDSYNIGEANDRKFKISFKIFKEDRPLFLKSRLKEREKLASWESLAYVDKQIAQLPGIIKHVLKEYPNQILSNE